ncbi:CDP-glycerol glycerophosphotransferase family protein, partial [Actinocorallia lasiicapitis]
AELAVDGGELALTRTRYGTFVALVREPHPVVRELCWTDDGTLRLTGTWSGGDRRPSRLVLRRNRSAEEHAITLDWSDTGFTAEFRPAAMPLFGADVPVGQGVWRVLAGETPVLVAREALAGLPGPRRSGRHDYEAMPQKGARLALRVRTALRPDERGPYAQRRLQQDFYPARRAQPVRELAVFDAYRGRQYSCNPRGIFEELRRRETGVDCVWVSADARFPAPDGARTVLSGSHEHYDAVAGARYLVGNFSQEPWYTKRPGQTYLQCWHGTPLKKLGHDLRQMPYKRTEGLDWMENDVPQWDLLLAQNEFSVPLFRSAFRYDGEITVSGYPRNDALHHPDAPRRAAEVRARLGIPPGKKAVLYAPTWRDDLHAAIGKRGFRRELDLNRLAQVLGDDHVVLFRTHYLVTDRPRFAPGAGVVDVTAYPDITDLYLVADALITDYSSAMFDFASTRRPMFFFAYDLERYRDEVRGFYLDFEAPGPVLRTADELFDALRADPQAAAHAPRYDAFVERYCPQDDGSAAARVVARLLGGSSC